MVVVLMVLDKGGGSGRVWVVVMVVGEILRSGDVVVFL